jgi:hypothetical protein
MPKFVVQRASHQYRREPQPQTFNHRPTQPLQAAMAWLTNEF